MSGEWVATIALISFLVGLVAGRIADWTAERWAARTARELLGGHPRRIVVTRLHALPCPMPKCRNGRVGEKHCPVCNGVGWVP